MFVNVTQQLPLGHRFYLLSSGEVQWLKHKLSGFHLVSKESV